MNNPKISVIIPVYNSEESIISTLDSITSQTLKEIEIVVIDDGSTDRTFELLSNYKCNHKELIILSQENRGPSVARNNGLSNAKGEFIAFVDSDDLIDRRMYEELYLGIQKLNTDSIVCEYNIIQNDLTTRVPFSNTLNEVLAGDELDNYLLKLVSGDLMGTVWRVLYRRNIISKNRIVFENEIGYMEDLVFNIDYLLKSSSISLLRKPLYNYYINSNSITSSYYDNFLCRLENVVELIEEKLILKRNLSKKYLDSRKKKIILTSLGNCLKLKDEYNFKKMKNAIYETVEHKYSMTFYDWKKCNKFKSRIIQFLLYYKCKRILLILMILRKQN